MTTSIAALDTAAARASAAVAEAEALDRAGRHAEAIDALARAARTDVVAKTELALRLLTGDRAPYLPQDAVRFLGEAARAGSGAAAGMLAVLAAAGVHLEQSFAHAIDALVYAAVRGWRPAQLQLQVLARGEWDDAPPVDAGDGFWRSLGRSIDLVSWLEAGWPEIVCESPRIVSFEHFAAPAVCRWLIERSRGRLRRARVYHALKGEDVEAETRTNTQASFPLTETDVVGLCLQHKMAAACGMPFEHLEGLAVLHYDAGEENKEHFDFVDPRVPNYAAVVEAKGERVITFLVYLNDDYEGGETAFPKLGIEHKGRAGEGFYFVNVADDGAPDLATLHAGRPPRRGEKWVVSQFIRNRRVLP